MPIPTLHFSEELPEVVRRELEQFVAQLRGYLLVSLNEDGSLRTQFNNDNSSIVINNETNADGSLKQRWDVAGPWTLDDPQAELDNVVGLRPPDPPAGTYHDYAPPGIDDAVCLEIEPTGNITLTGIKRMTLQARKRILLLRNRDSSATITLKHLNTGSLVGNRFDLPGNVDVLLDPGQNVWLYYDIGRAAWTAAITTQKAGGLNEGGASAGGDVSGPASAVDGDIVLFDGTTGKLIKDSGVGLSGLAASIGTFTAFVVLNEAQIIAANATPINFTTVSINSGQVLIPISLVAETLLPLDGSGGFSATPTWQLRWTGDTTVTVHASMGPNLAGPLPNILAYSTAPSFATLSNQWAAYSGKGLQIRHSSAGLTSNSPGASQHITFTVQYFVATLSRSA